MINPTDGSSYTEVSVRAPARLHLGFLDLNASIGRKFGSIGLAIDSHHTHVSIQPSTQTEIVGLASIEATEKVQTLISRFFSLIGQSISAESRQVKVTFLETIPEHAGLGSGTQLAMVTAAALCEFFGLNYESTQLAIDFGRGRRSGIGLHTFKSGGFIVDAGASETEKLPPQLFQHNFPESWRIVLIMSHDFKGIHGQEEKQAFKSLPLFPLEKAQAICHLTLMKLLPALLEEKIQFFGEAVTDIQKIVGDHFAPMQGGRYTSKAVEKCLEYAHSLGFSGIAQSSWGPTGCIFVENDAKADDLITKLQDYSRQTLASEENLTFNKTQANNQGAIFTKTEA